MQPFSRLFRGPSMTSPVEKTLIASKESLALWEISRKLLAEVRVISQNPAIPEEQRIRVTLLAAEVAEAKPGKSEIYEHEIENTKNGRHAKYQREYRKNKKEAQQLQK